MTKNIYNIKPMMATLLFGGFLSLFNETILNVALSKIMLQLHVSAIAIQWLSTGYMLIVAIMVPTFAFFAHTFTTKQLYLGAMTLFLAGTIFASISTCFTVLLLARMLQATGTGLLAPIMINSALIINPSNKHGFVMGICTCIILVGPALGPIVSGIILEFFNWPILFFIMIPAILFCIIGGALYLSNTMEITKPKIDYLSIMLSAIGFGCIVYGMSIINLSDNLFTVILVFATGLLALCIFCRRQLNLKVPMLNIRIFKIPTFTIGAILVIIVQMIQFSLNIILPMLLENGINLSSFMSAVVLFPAVFLCSIMTTISGKVYDKIGGKIIIPTGLLIMFIFLVVLSKIDNSTSVIMISIINALIYLGISLSWSPNQSNALKNLSVNNQIYGVTI